MNKPSNEFRKRVIDEAVEVMVHDLLVKSKRLSLVEAMIAAPGGMVLTVAPRQANPVYIVTIRPRTGYAHKGTVAMWTQPLDFPIMDDYEFKTRQAKFFFKAPEVEELKSTLSLMTM